MESDIEKLRNLTDHWYNYCIQSVKVAKKPDFKKLRVDPRQKEVELKSYVLTSQGEKSSRCRMLVKSEHEFTQYIWKKYRALSV